jgi:hypothetical protein
MSCSKDDRVGDEGLFGDATDGDDGADGAGDGGDGGDDGAGDDGGDGGTGGDGDDDGTGGPKFDVAPGTGGGGDVDEDGCDKVDFLFVIDNSGSMQDEQTNLINNFPGFITTIRDVVAQDYHIMAVSTDNNENTGSSTTCSNDECTCTPAPVCCENACSGMGALTCNGFDCNNLPIGPCDFEWGAGKQYDADGNWCSLEADKRWFTETQPALEDTFSCVAHVGIYGSGSEKPMQAMQGAVSDAMNDGGGCNEGFLRDDAILVVVVVTDEEDDSTEDPNGGSPGDPPDWAQSLIDAKNGDPNAIVVLMLVGDGDVPGGVCPPGADPGGGGPGAEPSPRLRAFAELFDHGLWGSICETDYGPFFDEAISVIDVTCEEFTPPG